MAKYKVCPVCQGEGKYVNPNIDSQGLTEEDFLEQGDEFREDYFKGSYDVRCKACDGQRVVTAAQLADYRERLADLQVQMAESGEYYGDGRM